MQERGRRWRAKLRTEEQECENMFHSLKEEMDATFVALEETWTKRREETFDCLDQEWLPPQIERVEVESDERLPSFFEDKVPNLLDQTVGHFDRQLRRHQETFHIAQKKEERREGHIVRLANQHSQNTAQGLEDERALWSARVSLLECEIVEDRRRAQRIEERRTPEAIEELLKVKARNEEEADTRERGDSALLDNMVEVQTELQRIALENFGQRQEAQEEEKAQEEQKG